MSVLRRASALPLVAGLLVLGFGGPSFFTPGQLDTVTLIALYTIAGVGLTLVLGFGGQFSLGQGAFFAVGAYGYGVLTVKAGLAPGPAIAAALAGTLALAVLVGLPILRLQGHQLAVGTLAFAIIVTGVLTSATEVTGGSIGLPGVPGIGLDLEQLYTLAWVVALAALLLARNLVASRFGRALRALGADERASESLGVPVARYRLYVFALGGLMAGAAGVIYALYLQFLSPDAFTVQLSVLLVVVVAVGGLRNPYGALVGAAAIVLLTNFLNDVATGPGLPARLPVALDTLVYGGIILLIMRLLPAGLLPAVAGAGRWVLRRRASVPASSRRPT